MANIWIAEAAEVGRDNDAYKVDLFPEPRIADQRFSFTTATASAPFNESTRIIMVYVDALSHYIIHPPGSPSDATPSSFPIPPGQWLPLKVIPGHIMNVVQA